jgi:hypothetical protein
MRAFVVRNARIRAEFLYLGAGMSLVETLELLSKARQYVEQGEQCVLNQREIVDLLEQRGRDPLEAILFLETLEEMQDAYIAHMDNLERKVMTLVRPE